MGGTESRELAPPYTTPSGSSGTRHSPARDGPKRRRRSASVNCDPTNSPCSDNPSAESPPLTIHVMDPRSRKTIVDELRRNSVAHNAHCGGLHGLQQHRALAKRLSSGATRRRAGSTSAVTATSAKGLTAPPVFPKNLSLFDDRFNGGVYQDPRQDTELMSAVLEARKRWASGSGRTTEAASTRTTPPPPEFSDTRREADADEADTADSGRSSLTDVSSIPFQTAPSSRRVSLLPSTSPEQHNKGRVRSETDAGAPTAARQRRSSSAAAVLTHQRSNESDNSEEFSSPDEEEVFSDTSDHKPDQDANDNVTPRPIVTPRRQLEKRFRKASTDSRKKTMAGSPRKSSWQRGLMRLRAFSASSPKRRGSEGNIHSHETFMRP